MDLIAIAARAGAQGVEIRVRGHAVACDLSKPDGGADLGPAPAEMLVASLGSCIVLMVAAWCRRKGYRDGDPSVSMTYEMARNPSRIASIVADLEVPRDVPDGDLDVVRRIAETCPVHATLAGSVRIDLDILRVP